MANGNNVSGNVILICVTTMVVAACVAAAILGTYHSRDTVAIVTGILGFSAPTIMAMMAYLKGRETAKNLEEVKEGQQAQAKVAKETSNKVDSLQDVQLEQLKRERGEQR